MLRELRGEDARWISLWVHCVPLHFHEVSGISAAANDSNDARSAMTRQHASQRRNHQTSAWIEHTPWCASMAAFRHVIEAHLHDLVVRQGLRVCELARRIGHRQEQSLLRNDVDVHRHRSARVLRGGRRGGVGGNLGRIATAPK